MWFDYKCPKCNTKDLYDWRGDNGHPVKCIKCGTQMTIVRVVEG